MTDKIYKGTFTKVDKVNKCASGWAYVSKKDGVETVDHSGDTWPIEEVEKTAHEFMACRVGGESHVYKGGAVLVESIVFTKEKQESLGIDLGCEGWFVTFQILDKELLEKVEDGTLTMFSVGGNGIREEIK